MIAWFLGILNKNPDDNQETLSNYYTPLLTLLRRKFGSLLVKGPAKSWWHSKGYLRYLPPPNPFFQGLRPWQSQNFPEIIQRLFSTRLLFPTHNKEILYIPTQNLKTLDIPQSVRPDPVKNKVIHLPRSVVLHLEDTDEDQIILVENGYLTPNWDYESNPIWLPACPSDCVGEFDPDCDYVGGCRRYCTCLCHNAEQGGYVQRVLSNNFELASTLASYLDTTISLRTQTNLRKDSNDNQ